MLSLAAGFVVAAYALGANAVLLPPGVNSIDDSLSIPPETAKSQVVRVACPECAFSTKQAQAEVLADGEDAVFGIEGGAKDLLLNFTTSEGRRRLLLNGATIYPPAPYSSSTRVVVDQVSTSGDGVRVPVEITSSGLGMDHGPNAEEEENLLVQLRYTVLGVEKHLMELQDVKIDLLKTAGELLIIEVAVDTSSKLSPIHHGPPLGFRPPFGGPPHGPPPEMMSEECNMLPAPVCRFKHMLEAKIAHMRHGKPCPGGPAHGRLPSHIRPPLPHIAAHGERPRPRPHLGRPHHTRPWHAHRHGNHGHWAGAFARGFIAVLIPVVAGISVGLTVSLLGLVVGRIITALWIKYAHNGERSYASLERSSSDAEEGKDLMLADEDEEEQLPAYEHAPAYKETDEKLSY